MLGLFKPWHGPASADSECPLLVLLPPGPLICSSKSGCFCHPVTRSPALTFQPPAVAAGPCSHLLALPLCFRKDVNLNVLRGQGEAPSWDPSWPTPQGCKDSPVLAWSLHTRTCCWPCRHRCKCGVSLHFRAPLDCCFSSARSWSHPPDLTLPLDRSDLLW